MTTSHDPPSMPDKPNQQGRQTTLRESDGRIVPSPAEFQSVREKPGNSGVGKAARPLRDSDRTSPVLSDGPSVLTRLSHIHQRADTHREAVFNNLFSLINDQLLWYAFRRLKRGKAPGVDNVTLEDYEKNLQGNLQDLLQRLHRGSYRPKPSLRKNIPKGNGKTRPLGIACVEDNLVQRAVVMILEQIYEVDFYDTSYGFRPGRSCHQTLSVLGQNIATKKVNWVSDADIKGFFDCVCHERLEELLRIRISDPKLLALIRRFLRAGVMIEGKRFDTEDGVPQDASLSPLLANVYLHYVLDQWFERDVQPRLHGESYLIRFADDFIAGFELESDARRYQSVLSKRLARYSLQVAEDKTKLIRFGRFARRDCQRHGEGSPSTFDFLGFTHYCGKSRAGRFKLKRKTSTKKLRTKLLDLKRWFWKQLMTPVSDLWQTLNAKLHGHYQYYGVNDNWPLLMVYRKVARHLAKCHLIRRSQNSYLSSLEEVYPILFMDGLVVSIRSEGKIVKHTIYLALAINLEGKKELLGLWISKTEGAKFCLSVLTDLKTRGVKDIFIACVDGLTGFPDAIQSVFPLTQVQLCIVHLVRNSLNFVSYKDRKEIANQLKNVYRAPTLEAAEAALEEFSQSWDDKYPMISKSWNTHWPNITAMFEYPPEIRKAIYTTNAIESVNSVIRKVIRNRKIFPNERSAIKIVYLAINEAQKKWTMPIQHWNMALQQFAIKLEERFPTQLLNLKN